MCYPPLGHRSRSGHSQVARPQNQRCPRDTQPKTLVRFSLTQPALFLQVLIVLPLRVLYVLTHQLRVIILARKQVSITQPEQLPPLPLSQLRLAIWRFRQRLLHLLHFLPQTLNHSPKEPHHQ